jgi:hypothetical protein
VFDKTIIESLLLLKSRRYSPQVSYSLKMINFLYGTISVFSREVAENYAPLCYYAGRSGNFLPKRNYHYSLCNNPEERSSVSTTILSDITLKIFSLWMAMFISFKLQET